MIVRPFLGVVSFFISTAIAQEGSPVSCEPRSNVDPGRLNISVEADRYGIIPPCKAKVSLYIPRNTHLRSIDGVLKLSTTDGNVLSAEDARIDFARTNYGMFAAEVSLAPVSDTTCASLSVSLDIKSCRRDGGGLIECPEIRVKTPQMFAGLLVSGESLNICHDD